jgi:predicted RNA-binding protein associated with RNAse of E/G family
MEVMFVRKKLITKTYMRDVRKFTTLLDCTRDDFYVCIKHIIEADEFKPSDIALIFNGSYIVEIIPKNEFYSMRVYTDEQGNILEYYFDISRENGFDEDARVPYYDDLFLDVGVDHKGKISVMDENELEDALSEGKITKDEYDLAVKTCKNLVNELENGINKYRNMDIKKILFGE